MPTVLIVDDSAVDRRLAGGLLQPLPDLTVEYAENGGLALERVEQLQPDLVLTDLFMPGMDGLELVTAMTARHPTIPVIMMTGRGSEEIAVKALQAGAASYVPKPMLAILLQETVEKVLDAACAERSENRLMQCQVRSQMSFVLGNDATVIPPLIDHLHRTIKSFGNCDEANGVRICVALEEAINNALYHGNLEISSDIRTGNRHRYRRLVNERRDKSPYQDRSIFVSADITREKAVFVVRDEGPGFDPKSLPDPTDPANLEKPSGRGLLLMRTFMNSVEFNQQANEVTMVKNFCAS
jgi:CheY-like chemotaxis protein